MRTVGISLLLIMVSGCAVYQDIGDGPLIKGNKHATASMRCTSNPGGNSCAVYFKDHLGQVVDSKTIVENIDAYLSNVRPFDKWVTAAKAQQPRSAYTAHFPFKLYLLTMSPSVVMAVPAPPGYHANCNGQSLKYGYFTSRLLIPVCYQYFDTPEIANGSFWFSPDSRNGIDYIPDGIDSYTIKVNGATLELAKSGNQWIVVRQ